MEALSPGVLDVDEDDVRTIGRKGTGRGRVDGACMGRVVIGGKGHRLALRSGIVVVALLCAVGEPHGTTPAPSIVELAQVH